MYTAVCVLLSPRFDVRHLREELRSKISGLLTLVTELAGHIAAEAAKK